MNDVILALDGFKNIKIYYGDTDSVYIQNDGYEILNRKCFIGTNLYQSQNDYGKGEFLYGLFLAHNFEYSIFFDESGI